ncbi:acyl carrier protein [Nocardiopsis sediminis]|uniref:Acyl carrier protein n=1 Tax=Nocardiopsis sediminis TaxID=1778267 RepID=A0ABV8FS52_9ACTN
MGATTYDRLVDLLVTRFQVDREAISPDATFEELELDSLFLVELLLVVQSELGVEISEDATSPQDTVQHAAGLIDAELTAADR